MMSCDEETAPKEPFFLCVNSNKTLFRCDMPRSIVWNGRHQIGEAALFHY